MGTIIVPFGEMRKPAGDPAFYTTRWTVVLQAQDEAGTALEELCQRYWYPLYAFVRRRGHSAADAEDLTQEFFARLLSKRWLEAADQERGKFRTFLMMAMKRFLANEWDRSRRLKRGGDTAILSLDTLGAEQRFANEPAAPEDELLLYDRGWALTLLERTLARLAREQEAEKFAVLKPALTADRGAFDCAAAAGELGLSEGATRVAVHRLRKRYRELFREEISQTVAHPGEIEEEIRHLVEILAKG